MYIVIAGGGLMGTRLAARLVEENTVVVVEQDFKICEQIAHRVGAVTVEGSATNMDTLKEAGLRKADAAVGMMRNDADNLAFALLARHHGVERIAVRMRDEQFAEPYRLAGATVVVDTVDIVLQQLVMQIRTPEVRDAIPLGRQGEMSVFRLSIPRNANVGGMTLATLDRLDRFPRSCTVIAVIDPQDRVIPARGDTTLFAGGEILFVARNENLSELIELVTAPAPEPAPAP
jgi:trk system potassium uptake protein TrkA